MRFKRMLFSVAVLFSAGASGQSMLVIGGDSYARACFERSSMASLTGMAGQDDIDVCNDAISHGGLDKKDLVATYVNRGVLRVATEDLKGAVRDYNRAIALSGDTAEAYLNRGNLWFQAQHYEEAIKDYDRALELKLGQAHVAMLNKGMALEGSGHLTQAKQNYLAALEIRTEWPIAQSKLDRVNGKLEKIRKRKLNETDG